MVPEQKLTYGQKAVGITFNPSGNEEVNILKQHYADLIDYHNNAVHATEDPELIWLHKMAINYLQHTQIMSVKAATWES